MVGKCVFNKMKDVLKVDIHFYLKSFIRSCAVSPFAPPSAGAAFYVCGKKRKLSTGRNLDQNHADIMVIMVTCVCLSAFLTASKITQTVLDFEELNFDIIFWRRMGYGRLC